MLEVDVYTEVKEARRGIDTAVQTVVAYFGVGAGVAGDGGHVVDAQVDADRTLLHADVAADMLGQRVTQRDVLQTQVVALFS